MFKVLRQVKIHPHLRLPPETGMEPARIVAAPSSPVVIHGPSKLRVLPGSVLSRESWVLGAPLGPCEVSQVEGGETGPVYRVRVGGSSGGGFWGPAQRYLERQDPHDSTGEKGQKTDRLRLRGQAGDRSPAGQGFATAPGAARPERCCHLVGGLGKPGPLLKSEDLASPRGRVLPLPAETSVIAAPKPVPHSPGARGRGDGTE